MSLHILIIPGLKAPHISYHHSEELYTLEKKYNNNFTDIQKRNEMAHNDFGLKNDIIEPMLQFLENIRHKEENINITADIIENDALYINHRFQ